MTSPLGALHPYRATPRHPPATRRLLAPRIRGRRVRAPRNRGVARPTAWRASHHTQHDRDDQQRVRIIVPTSRPPFPAGDRRLVPRGLVADEARGRALGPGVPLLEGRQEGRRRQRRQHRCVARRAFGGRTERERAGGGKGRRASGFWSLSSGRMRSIGMPRWRCLPPRAFFSRCCGCRDVCTTFRRASMWTRLLTSHAFVVFFDAPPSYIDDITCPVRRGPSRSHFYRRSLGGIVHRIAGSALSLSRRSCATDAINSISQNHRGADIIDQEASVRRWQRRRPERTVARIRAHCDGGVRFACSECGRDVSERRAVPRPRFHRAFPRCALAQWLCVVAGSSCGGE
jgi:hypothetical protein